MPALEGDDAPDQDEVGPTPTQEQYEAWRRGGPVPPEFREWAEQHGYRGSVGGWSPGADERVDQVEPTEEQVAVWHRDPTSVPKAWWDWARQRGYLGPTRGWEGEVLVHDPVHVADQYVIERELVRWGWHVEDLTSITPASRPGEVNQRIGQITVVSFLVDADRRPVDRDGPDAHTATHVVEVHLALTPEGYVCDIAAWRLDKGRLEDSGRSVELDRRLGATDGPYEAVRLALQELAASKDELDLLDLVGEDEPGVGTAVVADQPPPTSSSSSWWFWPVVVGVPLALVLAFLLLPLGGTGNPVDADDPAGTLDLAALLGLPPGAVLWTTDTGPDGIFSDSSVAPVGVTAGADITGVGLGVASATQDDVDVLFNASVHPCGADGEVVVSCQAGAGPMPAGDLVVVATALDEVGVIAGATMTHGLAFDDDGDESDNLPVADPFDWDLFRGAEHWYRLEIDADGGRWLWAESWVDDHVQPRATAATAIEVDDHLVWVVPADELGSGQVVARATVFRNDGDPAAMPPDPDVARGDVSGEDPTSPFLPVPTTTAQLQADDLPADRGRAPHPRTDGDPDEALAAALGDDLEQRVGDALTSGDPVTSLLRLTHPAVLAASGEQACHASLAATIGQAEGFTVDGAGTLDTTRGGALFSYPATYAFPNGPAAATALASPDARGRLALVLGCESG